MYADRFARNKLYSDIWMKVQKHLFSVVDLFWVIMRGFSRLRLNVPASEQRKGKLGAKRRMISIGILILAPV